jgi:hypothetical protein
MSYDFIFNVVEVSGLIGIIGIEIALYVNSTGRLDRMEERIDSLYNQFIDFFKKRGLK